MGWSFCNTIYMSNQYVVNLKLIQYVNYKWKKVKLLSHVRLFVTPWTVAHQAPPSMEFSRQEYWSGLLFPSPEDLPNPGIEPGLPHCGKMLYHLSHQGINYKSTQIYLPFLEAPHKWNHIVCNLFHLASFTGGKHYWRMPKHVTNHTS